MNKQLHLSLQAVLFIVFSTASVIGQADTVRINLSEADSLLQTRNLNLLAAHYDIDKAAAQVVQAEVFDNPAFTAESFLYSPDHKGIFDPGFQKSFTIDQLIKIAGQRGLAVDLAEEGKKISTLQYASLVRSLKYQLHTTFFSYYYLSNATRALSSQLHRLDGTVKAYQDQFKRGNFSLKEMTRLKSTLFALNNSYTGLQQELAGLQRDLRILTGQNAAVFPAPTSSELRFPETIALSIDSLYNIAVSNRIDVALAQSSVRQGELKLALEKRKAIPDLHLGLSFDQAGSVVNNYVGLSLGFDLPIFNRNQGNIAEAEADLMQSKVQRQAAEEVVRRNIQSSVEKLAALRSQYDQIGSTFLDDIDTLTESVLQNYLNGNLSLLEFSDLFESYNTTIIDINRFYASLFSSYEDLNYAVGKELFH